MSARISLDDSDLRALIRAMKKTPEETGKAAGAMIMECLMYLEREVRDRTPLGAGGHGSGLAGSIAAQPIRIRDGEIQGEVGTPMEYAEPVELGSRPHMPPIAPIIEWVEAKLGASSDEAEDIARLIALKISHHGTKGAFMFQRAFTETENAVLAIVERHIRNIAKGIPDAHR